MSKTKNNKNQSILRNKFLFCVCVIFLGIFALAQSSEATNWYVRPSGGTGGGTSWTHAWNGLSSINWSTVAAGDTVCIAGGSYSSFTIGKSGNESNRITLKRATIGSPCAAAAGWDNSYDSQVIINGGINFNNTANGNYVTIDGAVDNGIKTVVGDGGVGINFIRGTTHVELKYIEMVGPGNIAYNTECRGIDATPWNGSSYDSTAYLLVSHCNLHDCPTLMQTVNTDYLTVEYTKFHDAEAVNWDRWHPNLLYEGGSDNGVIRYNEFYNIESEGLFFTYGGQDNWKIYGNIFRDGNLGSSGRGLEFHQCCSYTNFFVYNNTFVNLPETGIAVRGPASGQIYNNLLYNASMGGEAWGSIPHDYNASNVSIGEAHGQTITPSIFTNYSGKDYTLSGPTNAGTNLSLEYNTDMYGNTRGSDGTWDRGAYEYISGPGTTPPSISNGSPIGTLPFGTTQTTMSVSTNENATCRWSSVAGVAYSSMTPPTGGTFSTTGGASHSTTISGLSNGQTYNRYVRCQDTDGNANTADYVITFSVASEPITEGIVAAYSFDEGSGAQANDSSGNSNTGTISGATWTTSAKYGKALSFDGADDYVEVLTNGWTANKGTLELWAKASSFGVNPSYLFGHTTFPEWANRIQLYTDDADGWLDLGFGDSHTTATNIENLNTGEWHHIALTWDGTNYNLFVNGILKANGTYTGLTNLASSADIGNDGNPADRNEAFNGTIDEIRIYNKVLSQSEIQTDMDTPIGETDTTPPAAPTGLTVD